MTEQLAQTAKRVRKVVVRSVFAAKGYNGPLPVTGMIPGIATYKITTAGGGPDGAGLLLQPLTY